MQDRIVPAASQTSQPDDAPSQQFSFYWSAGILPAFVLPFPGGRLFEFRINADVPLAGKMPALQ
jgi:hypothetical protein